MPRAFVPSETLIHTLAALFYPDDLLPEMQGLLRALADVEVRYERERDRLAQLPEPEEVKKRLLSRLRDRRRREREPYVQRLSTLRRRMLTISDIGFGCNVHGRSDV